MCRPSLTEALRCAMEVGGVARWRLAVADGRGAELLRPTWDPIGDVMVDYFRGRTGVELTLPPAVQVGQGERRSPSTRPTVASLEAPRGAQNCPSREETGRAVTGPRPPADLREQGST